MSVNSKLGCRRGRRGAFTKPATSSAMGPRGYFRPWKLTGRASPAARPQDPHEPLGVGHRALADLVRGLLDGVVDPVERQSAFVRVYDRVGRLGIAVARLSDRAGVHDREVGETPCALGV